MSENFPIITDVFPNAYVREVIAAATPKHSAFNPCIAYSPVEGYRLLVRDSGYLVTDNVYYSMPDPYGVIATTTHICVLDSELNICGMDYIDDRAVSHVEWNMVRGMEDSRLVWCDDGWRRYGTLREHHWSGQCQIGEDWLDGSTVTKRVIHDGPEGLNRTEKNWGRIVGSDDWVYSIGPSLIREADGRIVAAPWTVNPWLNDFRGGSPVIPFENGYVSIAHHVTWDPTPREYWHALVKYNQHGYVTHYTPSFHIVKPGIQFAAGLVVWKDYLVASIGWDDLRCFFAYIPINELHWIDARN